MIGIIIAGGVMSAISAYMLFKIGKDSNGYGMGGALQALFFFIVIANFIVMGSAAYELRNDCEYLLTNETTYYKYGNNFTGYHWDYDAGTAPTTVNPNDVSAYRFHDYTSYIYEYTCTERLSNGAGWIYRIPVWLAYVSVLYLIIYFLMLIYDLAKKYLEKGGRG